MKQRHLSIDPKLGLANAFAPRPWRQALKIPHTNSENGVKLQGEMVAQTRIEHARGITKLRPSFFKAVTPMPSSFAACFCVLFEMRSARMCSSLIPPIRLPRSPALRGVALPSECSMDGAFSEGAAGKEPSIANEFSDLGLFGCVRVCFFQVRSTI